jgi:acetyltransferase
MTRFSSFISDWRQYLQTGMRAPAKDVDDSWRLADGTAIRIRAVRAGDGALLQDLVKSLSLTSRYRRFFYPIHELTPDMLARFTQAEPTASMTLLAVMHDRGREVAVGMAQCVAEPYPGRADLALVVTDAWQRAGIGSRLLRNLICIARASGIERLEGDVLSENEPMRQLLSGIGFSFDSHPDGAYLTRAGIAILSPQCECSPLVALAAFGAFTDSSGNQPAIHA